MRQERVSCRIFLAEKACRPAMVRLWGAKNKYTLRKEEKSALRNTNVGCEKQAYPS